MLPSGRSVAELIFTCDEGVMGSHNDRRTSKMGQCKKQVVKIWIKITNLAA